MADETHVPIEPVDETPKEKTFLMLPVSQWKKIAVGLGIAMGGAGLYYLAQVLVGLNAGAWTPVIVALASVLANIARKWLEIILGDYVLPSPPSKL
jgi:hypothetical protein